MNWFPIPLDLELKPDEVHMWRVGPDDEVPKTSTLREILSSDELDRAQRFHFRRDAERFIVARGVLRIILARYLQLEPDEVRLTYNAYGKPAHAAARRGQSANLQFNLSHSRGLVLFAFALNRRVGIDIEYIGEDIATDLVAESFFSAQEIAALRALPADLRRTAFFNCWTSKEAYIKARGIGLSNLKDFDVSLLPHDPAALLCTRDQPNEAVRWSLHRFTPAQNYVGTLAAEGFNWRLTCWQPTINSLII